MDAQKRTNPGDEYQPTRKEAALVSVLLNPENRFLTIMKVCELAKVSRRAYYDMMAKPEFVEYYRRASAAIATRYLGPVLNAFQHSAIRGSFPHGKVLLEMAGVYTPEQKVNVEVERELEAALDKLRATLPDDEYQHVLAALADQPVSPATPGAGDGADGEPDALPD